MVEMIGDFFALSSSELSVTLFAMAMTFWVTQAWFIKGIRALHVDVQTAHAGLFRKRKRFNGEIQSETFMETKSGPKVA